MPPAKAKPSEGVDPITLALVGILGLAAWCAWRVIVAAGAVIAASEDKETYAMFITDEGLKSDNEKLATQVNDGITALRSAESEASILLLICGTLALALAWRLTKGRN